MAEFTKITGEIADLKDLLHKHTPLAEAHRSLLAVSPDPLRELSNLRNKVEEKSSEIVKLRDELELLQTIKKPGAGLQQGKFRKDQLISAVLGEKPELTNEERNFLHLILPLVDKMWVNGGQSTELVVNPLEEKLANADMQIATLKDSLKKSTEEASKLRVRNEGLEGNVEALQSTIELLMTEADQVGRKVRELEEHQYVLMADVRSREEELEQTRRFAKEKYDLELANRDLELQLEKSKRNCEALKTGMEELAIRGMGNSNQDSGMYKTECERLERKLKDVQSELMKSMQANNALTMKVAEAAQSSAYKEQITNLQHQAKLAKAEAADARQMVEDLQAEKDIMTKRHLQEAKELRLEIAKEKAGRTEAAKLLEECKVELHRTQEVKMLHARVVAASANEKRFVETLRNQVDELEARNKFLLLTMHQVEDVKQELIREKQRNTELSEELKRLKPAETCT